MRTLLRIGVIALVSMAAFTPPLPVQAQSETELVVLPDEVSVPLGSEVILEVWVIAGVNVNAFDVTLNYDSAVITLTGWEHGDYLSNLAVVKEVDDPGVLRIAATQLASPSVSGDGILLELIFSTEAKGVSTVEIVEAIFSDSYGQKTLPLLNEGLVAVNLGPTFTPTLTPTVTATVKPSLTPTPEDTKGAAPIASSTPTATRAGSEAENDEESVGLGLIRSTSAPTPTPTESDGYPAEAAGNSELFPEEQEAVSDTAGEVSAAGDASGNEGSGEAPGSGNSGEAAAARQHADTLNGWLWAILVTGLSALAGMIVVLIRRRNHKEEDLLL